MAAYDEAKQSFSELLKWHLINGTRPDGTRAPWTNKRFAEAVGTGSDKAVRKWQLGQNLPRKLDNVERAFFSEKLTPQNNKWRNDLRAAFDEAKRPKGNVDPITEMQKSLEVLRGADFCFMSVTQHSCGKWSMMSVNRSNLPVYDVYVRIRGNVDAPIDTPEELQRFFEDIEQIELGTIPAGVKVFDRSLAPGYYQVDIRTRYKKYTEMLRFGSFDGGVGLSIVVKDLQGNTLYVHTSPEGFPRVY